NTSPSRYFDAAFARFRPTASRPQPNGPNGLPREISSRWANSPRYTEGSPFAMATRARWASSSAASTVSNGPAMFELAPVPVSCRAHGARVRRLDRRRGLRQRPAVSRYVQMDPLTRPRCITNGQQSAGGRQNTDVARVCRESEADLQGGHSERPCVGRKLSLAPRRKADLPHVCNGWLADLAANMLSYELESESSPAVMADRQNVRTSAM